MQNELDGLAATPKQVELYNEQMKGEIAVTRRYASGVTMTCDCTHCKLPGCLNSRPCAL